MASKAESRSLKVTNTTSDMSANDKSKSENSYFKDNFNKKLSEFYASQCGNLKKPWSKQRVLEVITHIKNGKVAISSGVRRTPGEYYWISKYDTMHICGEDYLILKKSSPNSPTIRVIAMEDYFDLLLQIHRECGHGGRDKMRYSIKDKFYIQIKAIEIFVSLCPTCDIKRNLPKKGIVTKPIISKDFNVRGQIDLIDFQSIPDKEYKWLLNYQDHATKFLHLRPLRSKQASEVALEVLFIFLEFGAPYILQSDNGREFTAKVLEEVVKLWPECKIVHGTPRHPQTQGSVERSNQDVENLLHTWMSDNKTTNWSIGCRFVQYQKNSSYHRIIGRSPYRALFGSNPKCGLQSSNIPSHILKSIDR